MRDADLVELQKKPVPELLVSLADLDSANRDALRRLETQDGSVAGRKGVIAALDALDAPADSPADDAPPAALDAAPSEKSPAWQAADYDGPLTIEHANWRREHVKPVRAAHTK